ncbi:hypothetical protein EVB32_034 [Rhizobium phage RHph_TM39]|uniref:Uncharacterized protein n=2 Tax=Cuauhnahuacvirus TaxID=3044696 RepID=A0A7S5R7V1_9CAUD|nr:hypothetical protein PQC16_gp034 [Rhizobium phage RHph_TM30]YP_010671183.1 hypothetical protein PQC17_gp034 [Rhizobium phage RHph_Y65]QIG71505.1 hypothetical protein EVB94_034 [Rhizobium phage RHph_TM40]QIG71868.1 hypothetical protein EVB95_034 [Rhizobium phage RHph_TM2_3B]QIG72230.1 hypothetical protein EVB96_034 [Rhizobium phage RHph_TM3_3_6]QIG77022.1 hypothetical protein EVB32_034 [Rhizobium phage RHph_TM39]QIG77362.1 hypothetical protein EVB61_034 [Rhizobium phage RHph_TM21B]QIG77621
MNITDTISWYLTFVTTVSYLMILVVMRVHYIHNYSRDTRWYYASMMIIFSIQGTVGLMLLMIHNGVIR